MTINKKYLLLWNEVISLSSQIGFWNQIMIITLWIYVIIWLLDFSLDVSQLRFKINTVEMIYGGRDVISQSIMISLFTRENGKTAGI